MKKIAALLRNDAKNVFRDDILIAITFAPFIMALAFRFGLPPLREVLLNYFDLKTYYPLVTAFFTLMASAFYGWVVAFMLLDDRDENILPVIAVTPLRKTGYLAYKIALPTLASLILVLSLTPAINLAAFDYLRFIPIALMACMEAPLMTLLLTSFAGNKVEALALAKLDGILFLPVALPFFTQSPLQYIAGILPTFWIGKSFEAINSDIGTFLLIVMIGFAVHAAALFLAYLKFRSRMD
jgi:fluoroquinolone transport system permease protein